MQPFRSKGLSYWVEAGTCPTNCHSTRLSKEIVRGISNLPPPLVLHPDFHSARHLSLPTTAPTSATPNLASGGWAFPQLSLLVCRWQLNYRKWFLCSLCKCVCIWWWEHLLISSVGSSRFWIMGGLICHVCWKRRWESSQTDWDYFNNHFHHQNHDKDSFHHGLLAMTACCMLDWYNWVFGAQGGDNLPDWQPRVEINRLSVRPIIGADAWKLCAYRHWLTFHLTGWYKEINLKLGYFCSDTAAPLSPACVFMYYSPAHLIG